MQKERHNHIVLTSGRSDLPTSQTSVKFCQYYVIRQACISALSRQSTTKSTGC